MFELRGSGRVLVASIVRRFGPGRWAGPNRLEEQARLNAISLGGDSDTFAATVGPIAEAMHKVAEELIATANERYLAAAVEIVDTMERVSLWNCSEDHCAGVDILYPCAT